MTKAAHILSDYLKDRQKCGIRLVLLRQALKTGGRQSAKLTTEGLRDQVG